MNTEKAIDILGYYIKCSRNKWDVDISRERNRDEFRGIIDLLEQGKKFEKIVNVII